MCRENVTVKLISLQSLKLIYKQGNICCKESRVESSISGGKENNCKIIEINYKIVKTKNKRLFVLQHYLTPSFF